MDFVPPTIMKMEADITIPPLVFIIKNSFNSCEFPSSWKVANVTPIFENKGSKQNKTTYIPVSHISSVPKVIQLIVNKRVLNFFESSNLFSYSQHGFRQKKSTFPVVATMHGNWIENKENKKDQAIAFLNLSTTFDTLSQGIFSKKT